MCDLVYFDPCKKRFVDKYTKLSFVPSKQSTKPTKATIYTALCKLTMHSFDHWRSQGGKVMWALLGHIVKGEGNAAKQPRIRAFRIIYTRARANLTRAQARVCPGLATPLNRISGTAICLGSQEASVLVCATPAEGNDGIGDRNGLLSSHTHKHKGKYMYMCAVARLFGTYLEGLLPSSMAISS